MPLRKASSALYSNSFFIFIIRFFPSLASLLVMIWYSRHLPAAAYGSYQHFWIHLLIFYPIMCLGLHVVIVTYSPDRVLKFVSNLSAGHYSLYLLWVSGLSAIFAWLQFVAIDVSFIIPFLFIFFYALTFILESFLIVFRNYATLVSANLVYAITFCAIHWFALQHNFSLLQLFIQLLAITLIRFVIYLIAALLHKRNHIAQQGDDVYDIGKARSLWLHLGLYDILQVLSGYVDKFVISILLTAEMSAIYYNGSQNIPFIPLLLSAAGSAVLMQLASGGGGDERSESIKLMKQSGKVLSCIVFPLFFFLLFYRSELIITIFTDKYTSAIPVFFAAILVIPVRAYSFTTILQRMHRGDIINIGAASELILACALMYPLYSWAGLPGVAISFVFSTYLQAAFYLYHSARILNVKPLQLIPYGNWVAKLIIFAAMFIGIHYITGLYFTGAIALVLGGLMMAAIIAVSLYMELRKQKMYGHE